MKRILFPAVVMALLVSTSAFVSKSEILRDDSELGQHMKVINKSMKKLRAMLKDDKKAAAAVSVVLEAQEHALAAKALDPLKAEGLEDAQAKQSFVVSYRKSMHDFINQMFVLEVALMEGDMELARATHKALMKTKNPSHKRYKSNDRDGAPGKPGRDGENDKRGQDGR